VAPATIARGFHRALGRAVADGACVCADTASVDTIVLSGGVMQNQLLLEHIRDAPGRNGLQIWVNRAVPPNDGGVSLGQAALVAS
jgi:hydrogenase maturation protein HypF